MTTTSTAQQLVEALLGLPAQLDRIEQAAVARQPIDVTIAQDPPIPAPAGYSLRPTEFELICDGVSLGSISERWRGFDWRWNHGDQDDGTWELHHGTSDTREDAVAAIIEQRTCPTPYRGEPRGDR